MQFRFTKTNVLNTLRFAFLTGVGAALAYLATQGANLDPTYGPALAAVAAVAAKAIEQWISK